MSELQALIDGVQTRYNDALAIVSAYTGSNTTPLLSTYQALEIAGVNADNLSAINSFMAELPSSATDSAAEVQSVVVETQAKWTVQ